jgi:hypothetical protein
LEDQWQEHIAATERLLNAGGDNVAAIAPERRREFGQRLREAARRIDPIGAPEPIDFDQARQRREMIGLQVWSKNLRIAGISIINAFSARVQLLNR